MEYKCKICEKIFINDCQANLTKMLSKHIREEHNISSIYEYILKVYYNNEIPKCKCGCGQEVSWNYRNALYLSNHGFKQYASCTHLIQTEESIEKCKQTMNEKWKNPEILKTYIEKHISLDKLQDALNDFRNHMTTTCISEKYGVDYRTIISYLKHLNMLTDDEYRKITSYNQYVLAARKRRSEFINKEKTCELLYEIIYNNPGKYNINSLITYFNKCHPDMIIHVGPWSIITALIEYYGDEIYNYIQYGYHSKEEYEFAKILMFYFSSGNVRIGKTLKYGYKRSKCFIYDICLFNKLIIEYDSEKQYHNDAITELRDKEKENFAINNGYKFMRLSKSATKDPNTINQIKKLLNDE